MRRIKILIIMITLLISFVGCQKKDVEKLSLELQEIEDSEESDEESIENTQEKEYIYVYVCGAVQFEGVYELPIGSRVYEAIEVAGGFRDDADKSNVNQAEVLEDEERVYVPCIGEEVQEDATKDGKVNINKASKEELMTLPGVGESRADSIIQYREEYGEFRSVEDIMQVSGIKEGLFEKIKDLITK